MEAEKLNKQEKQPCIIHNVMPRTFFEGFVTVLKPMYRGKDGYPKQSIELRDVNGSFLKYIAPICKMES